MAISSEKPAERRSLFPFFRRKPPWREIFGYHVGDIQETQPVAVAAGATVVGDIYAPQIMVVGLLSGSAISREVVVQTSGQIWGDIYAVRLHLEPGGLIRGWINTLSESDYTHWVSGRSAVNGLPKAEIGEGPAGLAPEHDHRRDGETLDALRLLQMETAVALAARIELEETFDQRLAEISGETTSLLAATREELKTIKGELSAWQEKAADQANILQQRETQIERQTQELQLAQQTLAATVQELDQLRHIHHQLEGDHATLSAAKMGVDQELAQALAEIETLNNRVHNIETALKDSLDHSADQEDALLRWQELAQRSEGQVKELEKDLQSARQQIEESSNLMTLLRNQRREMEEEWTLAQARIEELTEQLAQETAVAKQLLANSDANLEELSQKYEQLTAESQTTIHTLTIQNEELHAETRRHLNEIERLQTEMEPLRRRNDALMRQMQMAKEKFFKQEETVTALRQKNAELEKQWHETQDELERISQQPTKILSSPQFEALQREAAQAKETLAEVQTAHEQALAQRDEWQRKAEALAQQTETITTKQRQLEIDLRQKRAQLEASEEELRRHLQETAAQGQRLAESQATLIEREIQLQQAQQTVAKQQQIIKQMKQVAGQKISELEAALAKAQKS